MINEALTQQNITEVVTERQELLNTIKSELSRKLFFAIEEKLVEEEKALQQILDWQEGRSSQMSKYTFILNSNYFEQEFL